MCQEEDWELTIEFSNVEVASDFNKGSFDGMAEKKVQWEWLKREWEQSVTVTNINS